MDIGIEDTLWKNHEMIAIKKNIHKKRTIRFLINLSF